MFIKPFDKDIFDEIVFEHREKRYGAYRIRKKYNKYVFIGLCASSLFTLLFCFIIFLPNLFTKTVDYQSKSVYIEFSDNLNQNNQLSSLPAPPVSHNDNLNFVLVEKEIPKEKKEVKINEDIKSDSTTNKTDTISKSKGKTGNSNGFSNGADGFYHVVEQMPEFPGGLRAINRFIAEHTNYPYEAIKSKISGIVYVKFCISKIGEVTHVSIVKGINPLLDAEAIRVVKLMPRWRPGVQDGIAVNVWYTLPINFVPVRS